MPSSPTTKAPAAPFVCSCNEVARLACEGLPFYKALEGKRYCVLHYPDKDKAVEFEEALKRKVNAGDFNFNEVWFPGRTSFNGFTFDAPVNFQSATFDEDASFADATFNSAANFESVTARYALRFHHATFVKEANFSYITFGSAGFTHTTFKDYVRFAGSKESQDFSRVNDISFRFAKVEQPERLSFNSLRLRPTSFINVDARKFEFIDVDWKWDLRRAYIGIQLPAGPRPKSSLRLLSAACRNLAVNAEENHRYEEASRFRYMAMEARRWESLISLTPWRLSWWYWLASGYGERVWRAFVVLIGVWLVAAAVYARVGFVRWEPRVSSEREAAEARRDEVGEPLRWRRALTYSLGVMTLQKPEPRPATNAAQALVMLETILGPVQAALLALAIRRKFMR
jgi:hypothetical protein